MDIPIANNSSSEHEPTGISPSDQAESRNSEASRVIRADLQSPSLTLHVEATPSYCVFLGETIAVRLTSHTTGGPIILLDVLTPPGGGIPVLHTHPGAVTLLVLAGAYEVYGHRHGKRYTIASPPGTAVYVPDGAPYGYANKGDEPGRLLLVAEARSRMDAFVRTVGIPVSRPFTAPSTFPDVSHMLEALHEYGFTFVETSPPGE
jgi:quercetin dioxygenase-like cupin family protein